MSLEDLNSVQKKAVLYNDGPLLLLAGAGSGKTRVLTHKIAYLIEQGVNPYNILAITFTNKAAKEMKERVEEEVGYSNIWISTFHSTCVRILRREIDRIGYESSFSIYDSDDSLRLMKDCMRELDISEKQFPPKSVQATIGKQKDELIEPLEYEILSKGEYRDEIVAKVYKMYQERLEQSNALDFDDLINKTVKLFRNHKDVLEKYQNRFLHIMVDEYQDTNTAQYEFVKLLASKNKNICVVGDDDQSIYGWRGANINNILNFEKDYKNAKMIKLEQNYRSTKNILNAANAVIGNNYGRKDKELWTDNIEGESINYFKANNDIEEGKFVADTIEEYVGNGGKYKDIGVLYRQNSLSRVIEDNLVRSNLPYRIYGGVRFYDRKEIKDILAYLKAIYNNKDEISYKRIINTPRRGIGDVTIERITDFAREYNISFAEAINNQSCIESLGGTGNRVEQFSILIHDFNVFSEENNIVDIIEYVLEETGYLQDLIKENTIESRGRVENIGELLNKAIEFEGASEDKSLGAFLEEVALVADIDSHEDSVNTVSLMTLHSAKGLEFPLVFIIGFEENIFPSYMAIASPDRSDIEEERRLCYVGITRAEKDLYITSSNQRMQYGQIVYNAPSRFLDEIPEGLINKDYQDLEEKETNYMSPRMNISRPLASRNFKRPAMPTPKNVELDFTIGDTVKQLRYGEGVVLDIVPAGADYEVTVEFPEDGTKKFMAHLSRLKKV